MSRNYCNYYSKRKNSKQRIVIYITTGIVVLGISYGMGKMIFQKKINPHAKAIQEQQIAKIEVENMIIKAQQLKNEVQKENKMVALSGRKSVEYTFKNKNIEVTSKSSIARFLETEIKAMTLKECTYKTDFTYLTTYDNNRIDINVQNNRIYVTIYESALNIEGLSEDKEKTIIDSNVGILTKEFTYAQVHEMSKCVTVRTYDDLKNDQSIKTRAIDNVRENVINMCRKFGIKDYQISVR